jgi:hypothetical protein
LCIAALKGQIIVFKGKKKKRQNKEGEEGEREEKRREVFLLLAM